MKFFKLHGRALLLSAVLVVGAVCVSNGDNPSALVGRWVDMNDDTDVELFKDGTGVISNIVLYSGGGVTRIGSKNLTWKTEGKRFMLSYDNEPSVRDYELSGYELTLTNDGGNAVVWVRKDKVEEYKKKEKKKEVEEKNNFEKTGYFTDSRDGQKYRAVKIGNQVWMTQNLNYKTSSGSMCYNDSASYCKKYGRLYNWDTAKSVCPAGWRLPDSADWAILATTVGGVWEPQRWWVWEGAAKMLKSKSGWGDNGSKPGYVLVKKDFQNVYTEIDPKAAIIRQVKQGEYLECLSIGDDGWFKVKVDGKIGYLSWRAGVGNRGGYTDSYGFSALPGGGIPYYPNDPPGTWRNNILSIVGDGAHWWTSSTKVYSNGRKVPLNVSMTNFSEWLVIFDCDKEHGNSVRCVLDE